MVALSLMSVGCGDAEPSYLKELRVASPPNKLPTVLKTNGPFSRPIFRIAIDDMRAAVVTEANPKDQYIIWSTNDLRNWTWRAFTPGLPSALLPRDRLYWFVKGALLSEDYTNQPQQIPFPYDGAILDLVPDGSNFLAVSGTSGLYDLSETGHWSTLATVGATEQLTTVTRTAQGICAAASNTRNIWFWTDPKSNPVSAALPAIVGSPKQIVATSLHAYVLTGTGLLEGDLKCGSWKEMSLPPETGGRYSLASRGTELYLATASGLYRYDGNVWSPFPTQVTRAFVRRLRAINGMLYACHQLESDHVWRM